MKEKLWLCWVSFGAGVAAMGLGISIQRNDTLFTGILGVCLALEFLCIGIRLFLIDEEKKVK